MIWELGWVGLLPTVVDSTAVGELRIRYPNWTLTLNPKFSPPAWADPTHILGSTAPHGFTPKRHHRQSWLQIGLLGLEDPRNSMRNTTCYEALIR